MLTRLDLATTLSKPVDPGVTSLFKDRHGVPDNIRDKSLARKLAKLSANPAKPGQRLTSASGNVFLILDELGNGGQGVVYRAFSEMDNRVVAIKLPSSMNSGSSDLLHAEARKLARLNHPNIVKVIEYGVLIDGRTYLVMDYVQAESLESLIKRQGRLPQEQAATICLQIADAIEHAHQRGVVHRDLKPRNILVANIDGKDFVTVLDFGISFVASDTIPCSENHTYGSVFYLSPEQVRDDEIAASSDIYQLGLIFFECLTGRLPFKLSFTAAIAYRLGGKILDRKSEKELTPMTTAILRHALARSPKYRQASMAEIALQLKALVAQDVQPGFVMSLQVA